MESTAIKKILADQPAYRHRQIQEAIYQKLISNWEEATALPKDLRDRLAGEAPLEIKAEIIADGATQKAAIALTDGNIIESVLIKNADGRNTVCVSSQVGCALGCLFCATGQNGYKRNLTAEEIVAQALLFARLLKNSPPSSSPLRKGGEEYERVDNVVFMGMGEPFLNWDNVSEAIKTFNDKDGLNIAARSISISTCGITAGIRALIKFPLQINLALSLHAPNDKLRQELMPIAKKYPLKNIFDALKDYLHEKNRKIMIEYLMIDGINDTYHLAGELADLLEEIPKHLVIINLIPYNPTGETRRPAGKFQPSAMNKIKDFKNALGRRGFEATIRESLGGSIAGACGQLAGKK